MHTLCTLQGTQRKIICTTIEMTFVQNVSFNLEYNCVSFNKGLSKKGQNVVANHQSQSSEKSNSVRKVKIGQRATIGRQLILRLALLTSSIMALF